MPNFKYQSGAGTVHKIRLSAARGAVAGAEPAGAVDSDILVKVSKSNREFGIRPRGLRLSRTITEGADTASLYAFLPVLTETAYNAFALNATVTYGGDDWTIVAKQPEDF